MAGAVSIEFTSGADATRELLARFGSRALRGAEKGMARVVVRIEQRVIRDLASQRFIGKRSSTLLRSIVSGVRRDARGLPVGFVGVRADSPAARYAAIQHEGTVGKGGRFPDIVPVRAKALAVPLSSALDKRGINIFSGPRDPQLAGQLFKINRGGRPPLLARGIAGGSVEPLFILLKKVAIRPKPFISAPARELQRSGELGRVMARAIAREVFGSGAKGGAT